MKKIALLTSFTNTITNESGYIWETTKEITLSGPFSTIENALSNIPDQNVYDCLNDAWEVI